MSPNPQLFIAPGVPGGPFGVTSAILRVLFGRRRSLKRQERHPDDEA